MAFHSCRATWQSCRSSWCRISVQSAHSVGCGFTNCNRPFPFGENSGPSITKFTSKNYYFSVVQSVRWNWLYISKAARPGSTLCCRWDDRKCAADLCSQSTEISSARQLEQGMDRDFVFSKRWGTPAFPSRWYFVLQSQGGCLDWTWWKDSFASTIAWFNTPLTFLCVDTLKTMFLFHLFLQVWKNYGHW